MSWLHNFARAQAKSDFQIEIHDSDWDSEWPSLVSKQTVKADVSFTEKTLTIHLRQTVVGIIQDIIFHVLSSEHKKIDHVCVRPGKSKDRYEYHFKNGVVVNHACEFSYEDDGPMIHVLTIQFSEIELKTPASEKRTSVVIKDKGILHG